jgi:DNA-directed RNA polymerase subunit H (RpoH/RPB5)
MITIEEDKISYPDNYISLENKVKIFSKNLKEAHNYIEQLEYLYQEEKKNCLENLKKLNQSLKIIQKKDKLILNLENIIYDMKNNNSINTPLLSNKNEQIVDLKQYTNTNEKELYIELNNYQKKLLEYELKIKELEELNINLEDHLKKFTIKKNLNLDNDKLKKEILDLINYRFHLKQDIKILSEKKRNCCFSCIIM